MTYRIRPWVVWALSTATFSAIGVRGIEAYQSLWTDKAAFLAFPLSVLIPAAAFAFLAVRAGLSSQEGVLMQLGTLTQLFFIIALPDFALYLALGFPVVFLVVELFETRFPAQIRAWIKGRVIAC